MAHVIDQLPEGPITAIHLGAGALTLPRYVAATRPGSRQQVLELEPRSWDLVREHLPWSRDAGIRVRYGDARATLGRLPSALRGSADLVVVDIFGGSRIPAHVTRSSSYREVVDFLAPEGVVVVNVADGSGLAFARGQAATLGLVVADAAVLAEIGRSQGSPLRQPRSRRIEERPPAHVAATTARRGPAPREPRSREKSCVTGSEVPGRHRRVSTPSPPPSRSVFQVRPGRDAGGRA